ncbi:hypothetical protein N7495_010008 [Penicillium taxi]|uniref:uncharacterized protein n=1 Tax=Penicillium taxi TaxID=168475 RepID=UPI002544D7F5|nr:uncharacterized protein N7495_010008 [Penicillium taxi]KAJ5885498.1 hypothetical protein N7495_010008 [Penicillium taxi]
MSVHDQWYCFQINNVQVIINLYERGNINVNDSIYIVDGRVVATTEECYATKKPAFYELGNKETAYQYAQKA